MEYSLLQKLFVESSAGPCNWLTQIVQATGAQPGARRRVESALSLFSKFAPLVEQEAFARAGARLRDYEGTPFAHEQRSTLEGVYVAAAYTKLGLTLAVLLNDQGEDEEEERDPGPLDSSLRHDL